MKKFSKVELIDRIDDIDVDEKSLIRVIEDEVRIIDNERSEWYDRQDEYLSKWDDFVNSDHKGLIADQPYIHIPVTFEKLNAWHARMYQSIFSADPFFSILPLGNTSDEEMEATKEVLRWYLRDEINYKTGFKPVFDELLMDMGVYGWGVLFKRWDRLQRKFIEKLEIDYNELSMEMSDYKALAKKAKGQSLPKYKEVEKIKTVFDGIVVETIAPENVYFREMLPAGATLNYPKVLILESDREAGDIRRLIESGYYDREAGEKALKSGAGIVNYRKQELINHKRRVIGINDNYETKNQDYAVHTVFIRDDFDGDGVDEEYVFTVNLKSKTVLRKTFLDRPCPDGNRPVYKFDLFKRQRSAYSRGFPEVLYALNTEIDDFHNIRRASGLISNIPWGFYAANSSMEKEIVDVGPGKFYPIDNPSTDVKPMNFPNSTSWALQEEQLDQMYADKLTSMPAMVHGQMPSVVGALRSTSGMNAMMNESSGPGKVVLDRMRGPLGMLLKSCLVDLQLRLPNEIKFRVSGQMGFDKLNKFMSGNMLALDKSVILGDYSFSLAINNANYNPEKEKQDAIVLTQMLMNQFAIQSGIVNPLNVYNLYKNALLKSGVNDIGKYLTAPADVLVPQTLSEEYGQIIRGSMPLIVPNDDHQAKINGLTALFNSPEFKEAMMLEPPAVHPLSEMIFNQAINAHQQMLQLIQSIPAMNNQSGMEIPATLGSRSVGMGPNQSPVGDQGQEDIDVQQ